VGSREGQGFAVLHRLDYNVWDAWLHPAHLEGQTAGEESPVRLTRNGVSYEMALLAVSRAMGDAIPEEFAVAYRGDHPETGSHPQPVEGPAGQRARSAPLPMSYARYLIRGNGLGIALHCSGRTGGVSSENGTELKRLQDGDSLDTLIRWADEQVRRLHARGSRISRSPSACGGTTTQRIGTSGPETLRPAGPVVPGRD
jgi:hypothetical protein